MEKTVWVLNDAEATLLIEQGASVSEVAERLKVSRQTVYAAIRKGRVPKPARPQDAASGGGRAA